MTPTRERAPRSRGRRPKRRTSPLEAFLSPSMMAIAVVLPAPFGPSRATTSPASTRKSIPERARFSPKSLVTPFNSTTGVTRRAPTDGFQASITADGNVVVLLRGPRRPTVLALLPLFTGVRGRSLLGRSRLEEGQDD